ncbi:response regulator [Aliamphritea spongicola]|uniref:response regulator n=1 Tax=Aliamphritea spongicola TaxID=707589 RepID=UPI00196A4145|nr:response regulator [Aliamphritea spongicola]MBN3561483.1 response regulator [Aliamphritea spongicola]
MQTLTSGKIATLCNVNPRTVLRWITSGKLKAFRLPGGNHRVQEGDFIAFLEENGLPVPAELQGTASPEGKPSATETAGVSVPKVLIVDDEKDVRRAINRVLRPLRWELHEAADGFQAGSLMLQEKPDLVLLDLSMPGLDGYEVIRYIRGNRQISDCRILVISALPPAALKKALDSGADEVLAKPFDNQRLRELAQQLVMNSNRKEA